VQIVHGHACSPRAGQQAASVARHEQDANTAVFILEFLLRDLVNGEFQDRVHLHVDVGGDNSSQEAAQKLMDRGISLAQLEFLQGPVTNKAKTAPAGTTSDPKTEALIKQLPTVKAA
jgi:hypothetical protein